MYGVEEDGNGRAKGWRCVGELTDTHRRALLTAATTAIRPAVLGVEIHDVHDEQDDKHAWVVVVPPSLETPHLLFRDHWHAAPLRVGTGKTWMSEQLLERAYRARLDEYRRAGEDLKGLYHEIRSGRSTGERAWMFGVARPRVKPSMPPRLTRNDARYVFNRAEKYITSYVPANVPHPWESLDVANPRQGFRRQVAYSAHVSDAFHWKEAWGYLLDDGSIALAAAMGGARIGGGPGAHVNDPGHRIDSRRIEAFVADLMGILRAADNRFSAGLYEVMLGVEWDGEEPLLIYTHDGYSRFDDTTSIPLAAYTPITLTVDTGTGEDDYRDQVRDLILDAINQGGVQQTSVFRHAK